MAPDLTQQRENECVPVARRILKVIGDISEEALLGGFDADKGTEYYRKVVTDNILPILMEADIMTSELSYILQMLRQPLDFISTSTKDSIEIAEDAAVALKFGVPTVREMRLSHIIKSQLDAAVSSSLANNIPNSTPDADKTLAPENK